MNDMSAVITPKSDQKNADDFLAGPMTIKITEVRITPGTEQPVSIHFAGDEGKPWKCCKSMSRVLVFAWGPDARKYIGRSVTLYRDPSVKWAGMEVGGIRISHMSDIDAPITMALTATKGSRKPYTVRVLEVAKPPSASDYDACTTSEALDALEKRRADTWKSLNPQQQKPLKAASEAAKARISTVNTEQPKINIESMLASLRSAKSDAALVDQWTEISDYFDCRDLEVPNELHVSYTFAKESFAK